MLASGIGGETERKWGSSELITQVQIGKLPLFLVFFVSQRKEQSKESWLDS